MRAMEGGNVRKGYAGGIHVVKARRKVRAKNIDTHMQDAYTRL